MKVSFLLAMATLCLLAASCNENIGISGGDDTPPRLTEKNVNSQDQDAQTFSEDLESLPPEIIGGAYLTNLMCGQLKSTNLDVPANLATYGCGFFRKSDNSAVKIGKIKQDWTLESQGKEVPHKILELSQTSTVAAAFLIKRSDLNNGINASVKLEGKNGQSSIFDKSIPMSQPNNRVQIINQPGGTININ